MLKCILGRHLAKNDCKFFAATTERLSAATYFRDSRCDHTQHLVASIVSVRVVELLEVIDVDNGDRVLLVERKQRLVECAPASNASELVVIREHIRSFDQGGR